MEKEKRIMKKDRWEWMMESSKTKDVNKTIQGTNVNYRDEETKLHSNSEDADNKKHTNKKTLLSLLSLSKRKKGSLLVSQISC